jgi:tetratricopeptide (TPR) repeat protein
MAVATPASEPSSESEALQHKTRAGEAFAREDYVTASTLYCKALAALGDDPQPRSAPAGAAGPNDGHAALAVVLHSNIAECSLRMANFKSAAHHAQQALSLDPAHEKSVRRLALAKEQLAASQPDLQEEKEEKHEEQESDDGSGSESDEELHVETFTVRCPDGLGAGDTMYITFDDELLDDPDAGEGEAYVAQREVPAAGSEYFSVAIPEGVVAGGEVEVNILYDGSILAHPAMTDEEKAWLLLEPEAEPEAQAEPEPEPE